MQDAEILNMSKELNSLASTLLPETPGTVEKGTCTYTLQHTILHTVASASLQCTQWAQEKKEREILMKPMNVSTILSSSCLLISGGLTLKERLAESWCGKSYYERLAEMSSYEGDAQESDEEDATIDDLQSALQNALSKTKVSSGRPKKKMMHSSA